MNARFETMEKHIKGLTDLVESLDGNNKHRNSFSIWVFCHEHSRITGLQGGGEEHFLTTTSTRSADTYTH